MREVVKLPAEKHVLSRVAHLVDRYAKIACFHETDRHDLQVAVAEACTNAIIHGLHEDPARTFEFAIETCDEGLVVTVREDGTPFDSGFEGHADLTSSLKKRKLGGLGMHLIRKLMDRVDYSTESDGIKVVRMMKRARGAA